MKLQDWLTKQKLTHDAFARIIDLNRATVTNYCNGEKIPNPRTLVKIAIATGGKVTVQDFVDGYDEKQREKNEKHT